jgi:hypothetical protein
MKKFVLLLLIIFTTNTFSQTYGDSASGKFDKMADLANHRKDEEAKKIADELLSGKYGELSGIEKFYTLLVVADYYYQKDDYQKASDSYQQFLDFDKNENPKKIENKKIYIAEAKGKLEELKPKLSLVSANNSNTAEVTDAAKDESNKTSDTKLVNGNIASDNSTIQADKKETNTDKTVIQADKKETNTDKTVTLTVSGTGKTLEEARLNALRSAIEQAFGAFISSKTEILNDNLVKDEIVSIANGNVQKYDVVSQAELPNAGYAITLSATVSIDKLTSFAESKGVVVEFKGGMFGATIKLQKLNEESEYIAIKNLLVQTLTILESTYDYSLKVNEPKLVEGDNYSILFEVSANSNDNYLNLWNFFKKTIRQISLNEVDALAIESTGKKIWYLQVDNENLKLRNRKSLEAFFNFSMLSSLIASNSFNLKNNLETVKIENQRALLFVAKTGGYYPESYSNLKNYNGNDDMTIISKPEQIVIKDAGGNIDFLDYIKKNKFDFSNLLNLKIIAYEYYPVSLENNNNRISIMTPFSFQSYFNKDNKILKYSLNYNLSDLEKINSFEIEKRPFIELMNNYESYRIIKERQSFGCFLKGTKISIPNGYKFIEDIKVGDEVTCFDDKGNLHTSTVESINKHENQEVYKYNVWNGSALYATPNHWVLTSENSFTEIGKLNEMLTLVDINGGLKPITKVEYFGKEAVYNFIVKDYHTYIANDIRVHNGGKGKYHMNISKK